MRKLPHVALLVETSRAYGRGLLRGTARYLTERGPWSVYFRPQGLDDPPPHWLRTWRGDGILARVNDRRMARAVLRTGLPVVDLRNAVPGLGLPGIGPNNRSVARLAVEHLRERGFRHFAFCGVPPRQNRFLDARREFFRALAARADGTCGVFLLSAKPEGADDWETQQERLARWLVGLPKPVGIMACHDDLGQRVLDACLRANLPVPDRVAVVGVDNDGHLCGLSNPPLTSVDVNAEQIGYQAAALLARLMAGRTPPRRIIEIEPRGIVTRRSTDVLVLEDREVAEALERIRRRGPTGLRVAELASELAISQSTLQRRFRRLLGRTIKDEILRVQIERVKQLLAHSDLRLEQVASQCGFSSGHYLSEVFHKREGLTPRAYRNLARPTRGP